MHKITSTVKTGGLLIILLVFTLSFLVASTENNTGLSVSAVETVPVSCYNLSDGSIDVSVTGGDGNYTYSWIGPEGFSSSVEDIINLADGDYSLEVTDQSGNSGSITINISQPQILLLQNSTSTDVLCHGESSGTITAGDVTGGNSGYEFSIDNTTWQTSKLFEGLSIGTYNIWVRDNKGCTANETITISQPEELVINNTDYSKPSCRGGSDASIISIDVTGGTSGYQYKLDNGTYQNSKNFTGLSAGVYTIYVKDDNDCVANKTIEILEPEELVLQGSTTVGTSCDGTSDGQIIAATATGGNPPYEYKINGRNYQTGQTFSNFNAGNYTITVKDASGCTDTESVTVTEPDPLQLSSSSFEEPNCSGESNGTLTVGTVTGGTTPYQYQITGRNYQSANTFENISAGDYTISVIDANNCEITDNITVTQPEVLSLSGSTFTPVSCNGGSDATVTAGTVSGGNSGYQYSIDGGSFSTSSTFENLQAGEHILTVRDNKGCETSETITVTQPDILNLSGSTSTSVSCYGGTDGTITVGIVTGGNSTFQFSINNGSFSSTQTFTGLTAGDYIITVRDDKGCEDFETITVTEPDQLVLTGSTSTPVSCNGGSDGTITAGNVSGGNSGFEYSINGVDFSTNKTFTGLGAGNHTVTVRDNKGCETTQSITVTEPEPLSATIPTTTPVSCNGGNDGTITAGTASGGNGNYSYAIDDSAFGTNKTFSGLSAGNYTLKIRDAKNCEFTQIVEVTEPEPLSMTEPSSTEATCFNGADGTITVGTMSGGNGNYQYSLDNTNFTSETTFTGLTAGNYTIFVKDGKDCAFQKTITVTQPPQLTASISKTNVSCFQGNDGKITLSQATGGHGNFEFSTDGTTWQTGTVLEGLTSGTYTVYIRDADYPNCERILNNSVQITQPSAAVSATITTTRTTEFGTASGTATANGTGGTPGYTYEWRALGNSNVLQTTKTATNLTSGDYELTIIDTKGCSYKKEFTIVETIDATIVPTSICSDNEEELIRTSYFEVDDLTARGGVGPYTYQWTFGADSTPSSATGPGSHEVKYSATGNKNITLTVTDSQNVSKTFNYTQFVGECYRDNCGSNDFIASSYYVGDYDGNAATIANCNDGTQKYIHMTLSSGTDRYSLYAEITYTITNVATGESETLTENGCFYEKQIVPNKVRTIPVDWDCGSIITVDRIYLTFSNNIKWGCGQGPNPKCYSTNNQETVVSPLFATATPNEILCYGDEFGTIEVRASGGKAPYQYSITSATSGFQSQNTFSNLPAGDYDVWVKDYDGLIYQVPTVTITQPDNPISLETTVVNPTCFGGEGEASVVASGGTPFETGEPYQYLWNDASEQTTSTATGLTAGEYTITVIDANGCQAIETVTITEPEELTPAETGPNQVFGCGFNSTILDGNSPETGTGTWTIDTANSATGGSIADPSNPNSEFTGSAGTYTLIWTVAHPDGSCATSSSMTVTFSEDCSKLDFDGIDDHVILNDNYPFTSGPFSIEVWVKPKSITGVRTVLSKRDYSNITSGGFDLIINNGAPTFRWGANSVSTSGKLTTERWYHLAVIYNNSNIELYVDGIKVGNSSGTNPAITSAPFLLGGIYDSSTPEVPKNYFHGWMEELRIWNTALTPNQLRFMMNQRVENSSGNVKGEVLPMNVPGPLAWSSLKGYYRLMADEITNGETPDISLTPVNGILKNIETLQENTAPLPYISNQDGSWRTKTTWLRPNVWDVPNGVGINGEPINWNIAELSHNIYSTAQDIYMLGVISHSGELMMDGNVTNETGQGLTITHYLKLDGSINLEGESQLVQTEGSILDEASSGYLDRDQQGTENSFNYNYWTSPVSLQGNSNNSGFQIANVLKDGTNPASPGPISYNYQYHYADPSYNGNKRISTFWLYIFHGAADIYGEWHQISQNDQLLAGEGYTMKGTKGSAPVSNRQNYVFRGKPNNGDIQLSVSQGENRLIGNPYPSAIDAEEFIRDNLKDVSGGRNTQNIFNGAIYYWDHFGSRYSHHLPEYVGGYAVFNLSGGVPAVSTDERIDATGETGTKRPGKYIPVAQGFFVNAVTDEGIGNVSVAGGNITFKNRQRVFAKENSSNPENASSLFLTHKKPGKVSTQARTVEQAKYSEDTRYKIRLHFASPKGYHREILVTADSQTSNGFDLGYDAPLIEDNAEDMYWLIGESEFVIQAVPNFNYDQKLPIGIKIGQAGEFSIDIRKLENFPKEIHIYLHDKKEDTYHDLSEEAYLGSEEVGYINDRYEIVFQKPQPQVEEPVSETPGTSITTDYLSDTKEIIIHNKDLIKINQVELYGLNGQSIESFNEIPLEKTVKLKIKRPVSSAIYIVRVFTDEREYARKIIIKR